MGIIQEGWIKHHTGPGKARRTYIKDNFSLAVRETGYKWLFSCSGKEKTAYRCPALLLPSYYYRSAVFTPYAFHVVSLWLKRGWWGSVGNWETKRKHSRNSSVSHILNSVVWPQWKLRLLILMARSTRPFVAISDALLSYVQIAFSVRWTRSTLWNFSLL